MVSGRGAAMNVSSSDCTVGGEPLPDGVQAGGDGLATCSRTDRRSSRPWFRAYRAGATVEPWTSTERFAELLARPEPEIAARRSRAPHRRARAPRPRRRRPARSSSTRSRHARTRPDGAELPTRCSSTDGFTGNTVDYADPANSYLDDVLDRRLGIPITLSVLMIEVGRRVGVDVHGVGMPGHFLVGGRRRPVVRPVPRRRRARPRRLRGAVRLDVHGRRAAFRARSSSMPVGPARDPRSHARRTCSTRCSQRDPAAAAGRPGSGSASPGITLSQRGELAGAARQPRAVRRSGREFDVLGARPARRGRRAGGAGRGALPSARRTDRRRDSVALA